jgi:arsenate reductase
MTTTIYGIKNCDTMKRAFAWLNEHRVEYVFHDYKKAGVTAAMLESWASHIGWEKLLNTRGTTWRRLSEAQREGVDSHKALELMQQQPSLIKRPVLAHGRELLVGFDASAYEAMFG